MVLMDGECRCIVCRGRGVDERFTRFQLHMVKYVRRSGWGVNDVFGDDSAPGWAYTVGLWHTFRHPEVVIFGLNDDLRWSCLEGIGEQVRDGRGVADGESREGMLKGVSVLIRAMHPSWRISLFGTRGSVYSFYEGTPLPPFLQMVWPDTKGNLPWDDDVDPEMDEQQPFTWVPHDDHPRGVWTTAHPARRKRGWRFVNDPAE
ncbi:DUF4262 domain-containing protein [Nonomuraea sp. NPDC050556]|uniref:DUF4262 domain-containing protein n=1 Tax=Nonomuraea sp. NPDC050556 TaxID=3364369 RepID=UPI0037A68EC4